MVISAPPRANLSAAIAIDCKPGRAEAIDRHGAGSHRKTCANRRRASDVHALLRFRHGATHDHVFNFSASSPGTRARASLITAAPISSGRVFLNVPLGLCQLPCELLIRLLRLSWLSSNVPGLAVLMSCKAHVFPAASTCLRLSLRPKYSRHQPR